MMSDSRTQQPRVFEVRYYITPFGYEEGGEPLALKTLSVTTAEIVSGRSVNFGSVVQAALPVTSGLTTDLMKAMGATMGERVARRLRGEVESERPMGVSGRDVTQLRETP